jgi:hypothetical protein
MIQRLKVALFLIFFTMLGLTVWASLESNVWEGFAYLFANRWGIATLGDTYFGFFLLSFWMFYKESTFTARLVWFLLICSLGSMALAFYIWLKIHQAKPKDLDQKIWVQNFLLRSEAGAQ